jgi:hypothetical protein
MAQAGKLSISEVAELLMYHMSESEFDPANAGQTSLTSMLANVEAPKVCQAKSAFKLQVSRGRRWLPRAPFALPGSRTLPMAVETAA